MTNQHEQLLFPLTEKELEDLRLGRQLRKHFHLKTMPRLDCVLWNKEKSTLNKNAYDPLRRQGISIANIPLGSPDFQTIAKGDCVTAGFGSFNITVVLQSQLNKLKKFKGA